MKDLIRTTCALGAALALSAAPASAAFITPSASGWDRGDPYTTFQTWETFSSPAGPNPPTDIVGVDPALNPTNPNGTANVVDTSGGSFVTSGGNIYSFSVPLLIDTAVPEYNLGGDYATTVLFQTKTLGTEPNYATIRLTYNDGTLNQTLLPVARQELSRESLGGFGGTSVEYAVKFEVPHSPSQMLLEIDASGSSMSFDRAAVDSIVTRESAASPLLDGMNPTIGYVPVAVPEPASAGLLAAGGLALLARRRRSGGQA